MPRIADATVVGVLDLAHLGDRVGDVDQLRGASRPVTTRLTFAGRSRIAAATAAVSIQPQVQR